MRKCTVLKTNQINGSWASVFSKILFKKALIVRSGYTPSRNFLESKEKVKYYISKFIEMFAYKFADVIITTSNEQKNYLNKKYNITPTLIENYIDTTSFKPMKSKEKKDLIFVGRLSEVKNLTNLIYAVSKTNYTLDIYGAGELKSDLERLIKKLNMEKRIKLKGVVQNNELPNILNKYKAYIQVSLYEGMPKTILEAMSCGLCCIGSDVSGTKEIILHNKTGILTKTDKNSIQKNIDQIMNNKNLRLKLGKNAHKYILEKFSFIKISKKEINIHKELLNKISD